MLLGKVKTAKELLALFDKLPDEEKETFINGLDKEIPTEEAVAEPVVEEPAAEPTEETNEAVEEVEEPVEEAVETPVEEPVETPVEEPTEEAAEEPVEEKVEEPVEEVVEDATATDNKDEIIEGLTARIVELEKSVKEIEELKALMQDYTAKQADKFGYKGEVKGGAKPLQEYTATELKESILKGEIR